MRASDVPTYVQHGGADLGVVGLDTLIEHGGEGLYRPLDLGVARCRMSVAAPLGFDYAAAVQQGSRIRVATKFTRIARDHFADKGVHVDLIKLYGSMELAPLTGLADAIVDLVASGNTLKANALAEVEEIMQISARLVVNRAALKLKREPIRAHRRRARRRGEGGRARERRASAGSRRADAGFAAALTVAARLFGRSRRSEVEASVAAILADVRTRGDAAVLEYTRRFDGIEASSLAALEIGANELAVALADARAGTAPRARKRRRPRARFPRAPARGRRPLAGATATATARLLGQKVTPLERVGIYVPGGKAAYPSSVLMNARAGAASPASARSSWCAPMPRRRLRNALVLAAAAVAGVDRAVHDRRRAGDRRARLRHGDDPGASHKITGPGNAYVASAKRRVFGTVGIDMIAGPSEILVLADGTTPPDWVAMDLFSQAEHDELAQSILLCPDAAYIAEVPRRSTRCCRRWRAATIIRASLEGRGALVLTQSMEEACEISNRIAPEHLEVSARDPQRWEPLLRHAGAIFLGAWTSESLGDYCAGPNHVLPTAGTARFSSPLGVYDFQKRTQPDRGERARRRRARADRRRAGARRRPAGARARGRDADRGQDSMSNDKVDERYARVIRQDVQSMHAYAIQDSARPGQARRDGEPVPPARGAAAGARRAARPGRDQPLSDELRRRRDRRALEVRRAAGRLQADARQRLRRADLAAGAGLRHARRGDPRAAARLRDVRDVGAACRA